MLIAQRIRSIYGVGLSAIAFACGDSTVEPQPIAGDGTFSAVFSGAFDVTTAGWSWIDPQPLVNPYIVLSPIDLAGNLAIYVYFRGGFSPPGDYPVGHYTDPNAKVEVRVVRELPGGTTMWQAVSGTAHLDASSSRGVIGTAAFTATVETQPPLQASLTFSAKALQ